MNNADVFKRMFGIYAEEFWAFPKDKMLDWLQYENVSDTNVGDLISRQAMRQAMYHEAFEKDSEEQKWESGCWIRYKMFERVIDAQPSAQPKKGRWIDMDDHVMCSCCGATHYGADKNYCPNCGADMRGNENE